MVFQKHQSAAAAAVAVQTHLQYFDSWNFQSLQILRMQMHFVAEERDYQMHLLCRFAVVDYQNLKGRKDPALIGELRMLRMSCCQCLCFEEFQKLRSSQWAFVGRTWRLTR